jgi:enterochelin esterase-like enzyme
MMNGKLITIDSFPSHCVDPRSILIWLPPGYDIAKRYAVLYMHDGQMLFDSTTSWNGQDWQVDETVSRLIREKKIMDVIVVGIPNNGWYRNAEYFPEAILDQMPSALQEKIIHEWLTDKPLADNYLKFITSELKPYVDHHYSTYTNREYTFIMGASMGGLIASYAVCRYPEIFRGAGCLSTHWPMLNPAPDDKELYDAVASYYYQYLAAHLPDPASHLFYFDHGTETLDALYAPLQEVVDNVMKEKGYGENNWMSKVFPGEDHSEHAWAKRLEIPLQFLLRSKE